MRVLELWRHPIKSMQGECLDEAEITANGLVGDREWGVRDLGTGKVLTGRRDPQLLLARGRLGDEGPVIELPAGDILTGVGPATDAALSRWLGKDVSLVVAADEPASSAEFLEDATDDASTPIEWTMPQGRFVDAMPLLLLTDASLRAGAALHREGEWVVRRFRPNVFIEADGADWVEDSWCGAPVRVGDIEVTPRAPCSRCSMVTRPQPGLERDLDVFRTLARNHKATLGVWTTVNTPGVVRVGDVVSVGG